MSGNISEKSKIPFKIRFTFEQRKKEFEKIKIKFPDKIPIIVEQNNIKNSTKSIPIDANKFLVPNDITFSQFIYVIRKRTNIPAEDALFFFVNNTIPSMSVLLSDLYNNHKDTDGFLYIAYSGESTFGSF